MDHRRGGGGRGPGHRRWHGGLRRRHEQQHGQQHGHVDHDQLLELLEHDDGPGVLGLGAGFRRDVGGLGVGVGHLGRFVMPLTEALPVTEGVAQWDVWGTTARVVVEDPAALPAARGLVVSQLRLVDDACNRFRPDSELAALPAGRWSAVSPTLADLLAEALRAAQRTGGDVDPTLGDAMCALGYDRPLARFAVAGAAGPVEVEVVTRGRRDWRAVELEGRRVRVPAGLHLDLGATAKAVAADRAARLVADRLGTGVLVALGGDVATAGSQRRWEVLVSDGPGEPSQVVALPAGGALATSSTRSRRWRCGTREVHHVLDPRTLLPADPVWRTVSVAAGSCVEANTASTAALVRGRAALGWFAAAGVSARCVAADGTVRTTGRWPV